MTDDEVAAVPTQGTLPGMPKILKRDLKKVDAGPEEPKQDENVQADIDGVVNLVAPQIYQQTFEDIMGVLRIHVKDEYLIPATGRYGKIRISAIPDIKDVVEEIQSTYDANQRDTVASLVIYGNSIVQHLTHTECTGLKNTKLDDVRNGRRIIVRRKYGKKERFFTEGVDYDCGSLVVLNVMGDKNDVIAAIGEQARYFNLSAADMAQIDITHALVMYEKLHPVYKELFESFNKRFVQHVERFITV